MSNYIDSRTVDDPRDFQEDDTRTDAQRDADSLEASLCDVINTNPATIAIQGDKRMKYFARQFRVYDYPHNGELCWCVVDSKGGFFVVASQITAETEANRRNAQMAE